jgi:predicted GIY-YIG superfamily endonuclease
MIAAIQREKQMKKWNRAWKLELKRRKIQIGRTCGKELLGEMKTAFPRSRE